MSWKVLLLLSAQGKVVRGRLQGSWTSTLDRWAPAAAWLRRPIEELDVDEHRAALGDRRVRPRFRVPLEREPAAT